VAQTLGALESSLAQSSLKEKVILLLISYEPEIDTPERLSVYAEQLDIVSSQQLMLVQVDLNDKNRLMDAFHPSVNFNQGRVNLHGIELFLIDKQGRIARRYHTLLWENQSVINDLARLVAERF
jgi:cytochrome oxidase Cu insertion factor (SCO1/SenC/PrrC family)